MERKFRAKRDLELPSYIVDGRREFNGLHWYKINSGEVFSKEEYDSIIEQFIIHISGEYDWYNIEFGYDPLYISDMFEEISPAKEILDIILKKYEEDDNFHSSKIQMSSMYGWNLNISFAGLLDNEEQYEYLTKRIKELKGEE